MATTKTTNWCIDGGTWDAYSGFGSLRVFIAARTAKAALKLCASKYPHMTPSSIAPEGHPELRVELAS